MNETVYGFLGVLLGAGIGLLGTWIQTRQTARLHSRAELVLRYQEFMASKDASDVAFRRYKRTLNEEGLPSGEMDWDTDADIDNRLTRSIFALQVVARPDVHDCAILVVNAASIPREYEGKDYLVVKCNLLFSRMIRRDTASPSWVRLRERFAVYREKRQDWYREGVDDMMQPTRDILADPHTWADRFNTP